MHKFLVRYNLILGAILMTLTLIGMVVMMFMAASLLKAVSDSPAPVPSIQEWNDPGIPSPSPTE